MFFATKLHQSIPSANIPRVTLGVPQRIPALWAAICTNQNSPGGRAFAQNIIGFYMVRYRLNLQQIVENKCFSSSKPTFDQFWNVLLQFAGVMFNIR